VAFTRRAAAALARHFPSLIASRFDSLLEEMCDDDYTNVSYKVFNIGEANVLPADSMELGIAVDGRHVEAVDRILKSPPSGRREGIYHTSPFLAAVRRPSKALRLDDVRAADDDDRADHGHRAAAGDLSC
jgi:hypothetical protein